MTVQLLGTDAFALAGSGNTDLIYGNSSTLQFLHSTHDNVIDMGFGNTLTFLGNDNVSVSDWGAQMELLIKGGHERITVTDLQPSSHICLAGQGYVTGSDAFAALKSDGRGGQTLALTNGGSLHILNGACSSTQLLCVRT